MKLRTNSSVALVFSSFGSILNVLSGVSLPPSFFGKGQRGRRSQQGQKLCGCLMSAESEKMFLDMESQGETEASNVRKNGQRRRNGEKKKRMTKNEKERGVSGRWRWWCAGTASIIS